MGVGKEKRPIMTAENIRELMDLNDWTKVDLASAMGKAGFPISENTVYRWIVKGDRSPKEDHAVALRKMLKEARRKAAVVK